MRPPDPPAAPTHPTTTAADLDAQRAAMDEYFVTTRFDQYPSPEEYMKDDGEAPDD